jgi:hypothetical protein
MDVLYPVTHVITPIFSGKLLINGDLRDNCTLLRFLFDKAEMVHPLIITIKVLPISQKDGSKVEKEKTYIYECNINDLNNPLMKTRLIYPEFLLKEYRIQVMRIESQVSVLCNV